MSTFEFLSNILSSLSFFFLLNTSPLAKGFFSFTTKQFLAERALRYFALTQNLSLCILLAYH